MDWCSLLIIGVGVHAWRTEYTTTGHGEGEECYKPNAEVWKCKKASDCDTLKDVLKENGKLRICSWQGQTPVLCCPPKAESIRIKMSKSEEKCAEYAQLLCSNQGTLILSSLAKPSESLQRKRREGTSQPAPSTTTFVPPTTSFVPPTTSQPTPSTTTFVPPTTSQPTPPTTTFAPHPVSADGGRLSQTGELSTSIPDIDRRLELQDHRQQAAASEVFPAPGITGGYFTLPTQFPSVALIGYGDAGAISWQCGGSLISENYVLSAAHCVNTSYGLPRWVRVGDLDLKSDSEEARPQTLEIVERVVHPGYRAPAYYNDLALFRLARPAVFDRYVRPACLHSDPRDPPGRGTAAGWGKNETNGPRSSALMQVDISFVPAEECKRLVGIKKNLPNGLDTDTMVCAGELGKDTCQGDSGGPLILSSTPWSQRECLARLVGVTSFGPRNCGATSVPGAYVRVAHFLPWIESIVWPE